MFEHKISPDEIYALSALLFVLGSLRTASVLVYQREKRLLAKKGMQSLRQPPLDSICKTGDPIPINPKPDKPEQKNIFAPWRMGAKKINP